MNWKKLASLGVVAMMSLSILGCGSDTASNDKAASSSSLSGSITGSGSSALLPLAKDAADKFKELHPEALLLPIASTGAATKIVYDNLLAEEFKEERLLNDYGYTSLFQKFLIDKI